MFREIRNTEHITEEDRNRLEEEKRRNNLYLNIEPKSDISYEECETFWNNIFNEIQAQ